MRWKQRPVEAHSGAPDGIPQALLDGPCIDVWASDVGDDVEAWWAARARWRTAVSRWSEARGVPAWVVFNAATTRRPYRAAEAAP